MKIRPVHIEPPAISPAAWPGLSLLLDGEKMGGKLSIGGVYVFRTPPSTRPRKCVAPAGFLCRRSKLASLGFVRRAMARRRATQARLSGARVRPRKGHLRYRVPGRFESTLAQSLPSPAGLTRA